MNSDQYSLWAEVALPSGLRWSPLYGVPSDLRDRAVRGQMVRVSLGAQDGLWGVIWSLTERPPDFEVRPLEIPEGWSSFPESWIDFLGWVGHYYEAPPNRLVDVALPAFAGASPEELLPKRIPKKPPVLTPAEEQFSLPRLTDDQAAATEAIGNSLGQGYAPFLLQGITGSGKTRVYAELARRVVASNQSALILVPEIALTPQMRQHFEQLTGLPVELYHSNLSPSERKKSWRRVVTGECKLLLGTRSAALLPLQNLGCIVVDEEHDTSYKQEDPTPYYHARDALLWRARQLEIPIVLGSATPSLESRELAESGRLKLIRMDHRANDRPLPQVKVIDMKEVARRTQKTLLSPELREAIEEVRADGGQTILLHNRRGFAPAWSCARCGETVRCPDCDIAMTYHRLRQQLHCHWCDRLLPPQRPCAQCGAEEFVSIGFGIEQVEEELLEFIPDLKLTRFDRDTTARRGELERLLGEFRSGKSELLLGTQMVAKGHDFPRVRLVGVVSADAGLAIPDFRAGERMFQLLTQVAGRAGRGEESGRVLLQTYAPDEPLMRWAIEHDYDGFRNEERRHRQSLGYPPFGRMVQVELSRTDESKLRKEAGRLATLLREKMGGEESGRLLGPAEAPMFKVRRLFRMRLLFSGKGTARFRQLLHESIAELQFSRDRTLQIRINIDPQAMM